MAIDLYSGAGSISGTNNFRVDHSPLEQIGHDLSNLPAGLEIDLFAFLTDLIETVTGLDISTPEAFVASLLQLLGDLGANIESVIEYLISATGLDFANGPIAFVTSLIDVVVQNITDIIDAILGLTGLNFNSPELFIQSVWTALEQAIQQMIDGITLGIENILQTIAQLFGFPGSIVGDYIPGLSELGAWISQLVFGFVDPNRLPLIPISHIGDTSVNLLSNPYFAEGAINDPTNTWTVDPNVTHHPIGGSAYTVCTDASHDLLSVDLIGVSPGQKLKISGWVKMENVVGDGPNGVQLGVTTFNSMDGSGNGTPTNVATLSSYGTKDWQKMEGVYTVPASGVLTLRVRVTASENTKSGKIWFDEMWCSKQGLLSMNLIEDLNDTIALIQQNIAGFLNDLAEFLQLDEWKKFLDGITGQVNATITAGVQAAINMLANLDVSGFFNASFISGLLPDLQKTWDLIYEALTGKKPPAPQEDLTLTVEQIEELIATTTANSTALAALQTATQGGLTNMVASGDDFERQNPSGVNPTSGEQFWQEVYTTTPATAGGFSLSGGQAVWTDRGANQNLGRFRRIKASDAKTFSAYQRVTRVTGTTVAEPGINILGVQTAGPAVDYIYARVSDNFNSYIYVAYDGDGKVTLGYTTSGPAGETPLAPTVTTSKPTAGTTYALEVGDAADLRSFRVLRNNITVLTFQDSAGKTASLDALKGWGWGGKAVPRGVGQSTPSSIHSITVADIPPKPTIGSFLHVTRNLTAAVPKPAGDQRLPANVFNDVVRNSPDVTFDLATSILVLKNPGPYVLTCRLDLGVDQAASEEWELLLYWNDQGVWRLISRGGQLGGPNGFLASSAANTVQSTFHFYNDNSNAQFAVGMYSNNAENIVGNAAGTTTWLSVTKGS